GALNHMAGRDHHNSVFPAMFAGGGVKGGLVIGETDAIGEHVKDPGWRYKQQPHIENVISTIYSALGIDANKRLINTPSGRTYTYVDPLGANGMLPTGEISEIYG